MRIVRIALLVLLVGHMVHGQAMARDWFIRVGPGVERGWPESPGWQTEVWDDGQVVQKIVYADGAVETRTTHIGVVLCRHLRAEVISKLSTLKPPWPVVYDAPMGMLDIHIGGRTTHLVVAGLAGFRPTGATLSVGSGSVLKTLHQVYYEVAGLMPIPTLQQLVERSQALGLTGKSACVLTQGQFQSSHNGLFLIAILQDSFPDVQFRPQFDGKTVLVEGPEFEVLKATRMAKYIDEHRDLEPTPTPSVNPFPTEPELQK